MTSGGRLRVGLALLVAGWGAAWAAPETRDIGDGLVYARVKTLPADLPARPEGKMPACVLDTRYVEADAEAALAFGAWLGFRAGPKTPVIVLANGGTSAALWRVLRAMAPRTAGLMVVGTAAGEFAPDVEVRTTAEDERKAYEALERGVPLAALIADNPGKVRNDEASLAREWAAAPAGEAPEGAKVAAPVDVALQRAVHLHRALVALKKI